MDNIKDLKVNLESKIFGSKKVVLVPHTPIDFDAFASTIGLSLVVSKLQKPFVIVVDDPAYKVEHSVKKVMDEAKKNFNIANKERYLKIKEDDDLFVLADVNKSNLICLSDELKNVDKDNIVIIDHHDVGSTTIQSNYSFIDTNSSSASEIIFKLLNMFKVKCPVEVANYLLAGIYLDTNKLTKNVTPDTFKIVAKLMENGASNCIIDNWFAEDFESDKRVLDLVGKTRIYKYSFAVVLAEEECEYTREELAKVADYLLKYGVDASFAVGKIDENIVSISARSKEKVNVGDVMKELDGGGNRYSAATKITDKSIEEVGKQLVKLIESPYLVK
jgi:c-di-AMP phosphodiesterase-like protein